MIPAKTQGQLSEYAAEDDAQREKQQLKLKTHRLSEAAATTATGTMAISFRGGPLGERAIDIAVHGLDDTRRRRFLYGKKAADQASPIIQETRRWWNKIYLNS